MTTVYQRASLLQSRNYYEEMATDPSQSDYEQRLWRQLADEITHRLNDRDTAPQAQSSLW